MRNNLITFLAAAFLLTGCGNNSSKHQDIITSTRQIHAFGFDVAASDWEQNQYPGKVITTFRTGVVLTIGYQEGVKHGIETRTYPHSQTLEYKESYTCGNLKKRTEYNLRGMPMKEISYLPDNCSQIKRWYTSGSPQSTEDFIGEELSSAIYYDENNCVESQVTDGAGTITVRNNEGDLLMKKVVHDNMLVQKITFHKNNTPHLTEHYMNGELHGLRTKHSPQGDPILQENWTNGYIDGEQLYFQNGGKYLEVTYVMGKKQGVEKHYIDGSILVEESCYLDDSRHGPTQVFYDGITSTMLYYRGEKVSKETYKQLCDREEEIARMSQRSIR